MADPSLLQYGAGFFTPEDQENLEVIRRRQALAQSLMDQPMERGGYAGLAQAGNKILGAFLANKADKQERDLAAQAQQSYMNSLTGIANYLKGGNANQPPQAQPGGGPVSVPGQAAPSMGATDEAGLAQGATNAQPQAPVPQSAGIAPAAAQPGSFIDAIMASHDPRLINQFLPTAMQNQMQRENMLWERGLPMTEEEKQKNAAELQRAEDLARFQNQMPMTAAQKAANAVQWAEANKPVSVGFGETLVSRAGKPLYQGTAQSMNVPTGKDGQPLQGDAYLATLPPGIAATAKAIGTYRQAPLSAMALRSPQGYMLQTAVNQAYPGYDATQYMAKNKARMGFATGKQGDTVRSLNVATQHLDQLGQLATALGNGDLQLANAAGQKISQWTGSAAPLNFDAAKGVVMDEVIKAVVGSGGGQGDREKAAETVNRANSPAQLAGVIQTYKGLMGGQLNGLKQQYQKTTGLPDFEDYLAPETRAALEAHSGGTPPPKTGGGGIPAPPPGFVVHP